MDDYDKLQMEPAKEVLEEQRKRSVTILRGPHRSHMNHMLIKLPLAYLTFFDTNTCFSVSVLQAISAIFAITVLIT